MENGAKKEIYVLDMQISHGELVFFWWRAHYFDIKLDMLKLTAHA
jgi:hypothetical protein